MTGSNGNQIQLRCDSPQIAGIARYHRLPGPLRANHDMGIRNISRTGSRQN